MGLRWPEWGETALTLLWAGDRLRAMRCPCGCGQWSDEAHDQENDGHWIVDTVECFARKALQDHAEDEKPSGHELVGVRLARNDDELAEIKFDPTRAVEIHAAHVEKFKN